MTSRRLRNDVSDGSIASFWLSVDYFRSNPKKQTFAACEGMSQMGQ
jgi:hypothetical protein